MAEKKILIIDYDTKSLDYLAKLFDIYEYQIVKATDGLSGYDAFKSEKPDLIILEAMLPKLHGFDLTKKISQETNHKVPIIVVSGVYRGPQYRNEALNYLGASDYFEKPIDEAKLIESVLNRLEEGAGIEEELPDSDSIIKGLLKRIKIRPKKSHKEESFEEKKEAGPPLKNGEFNDFTDKALSGIDVEITEEISSLLEEKKKKVREKRKS